MSDLISYRCLFLFFLQGPKGYQGPAGLPGEPVSAAGSHAVCVYMFMQNCHLHMCLAAALKPEKGSVVTVVLWSAAVPLGQLCVERGLLVWQPLHTLWTRWFRLNTCVHTQTHSWHQQNVPLTLISGDGSFRMYCIRFSKKKKHWNKTQLSRNNSWMNHWLKQSVKYFSCYALIIFAPFEWLSLNVCQIFYVWVSKVLTASEKHKQTVVPLLRKQHCCSSLTLVLWMHCKRHCLTETCQQDVWVLLLSLFFPVMWQQHSGRLQWNTGGSNSAVPLRVWSPAVAPLLHVSASPLSPYPSI